MKAIKKLNNNVALVVNDKGEQSFIVGKGLGFVKMPYEISLDDARIEKIFISQDTNRLQEMLMNIPLDVITLTETLIEAGSEILQVQLDANILLALSDHLNYALERAKENFEITNPLQYEICNLYPKEMKVGRLALQMIEEAFQVVLSQGEASFIALHFVNAQLGCGDEHQASMMTEIMQGMINIVKYHYKTDFDEENIHFTRFVTHIRYFIMRQLQQKPFKNENGNMYAIMAEQNPQAVACIEKIELFLLNTQEWEIRTDEKLYLMIHIQRLTS